MDKIICKNCTGCAACFNRCPVGAISMQENDEGFLYPHIDTVKCVGCHLCKQVCPVINYHKIKKDNPLCYAVAASDEIRKNSSSGGVFSVLALHILEQGGAVCGASFDNTCVCHIIIEDANELCKLQGSKYLQSDVSGIYKPIKDILEKNRKLLFCGTPCQVAGIKSFLKKDYPNLYLLDIVCHGVPSPAVFKKYINENFPNETFVATNFRDKQKGWSPELIITTTTTISTTSRMAATDDYMRAFLNNLCLRKTCGACLFNSLPRQGDLTLGDFWGIDLINKELNDERGLSEVLVNTDKGGRLLEECEAQFKIFEQADFDAILPYNPTIHISGKHHGNRDKFFKDINKTLHTAVDDNLEYDYLCLNFWTSLNYGAVLTAYAFQTVLESLGYTNAHIDYRYDHVKDKFDGSFTDEFARKYLHQTRQYYNYKDFRGLNKIVRNGFIVGSDQVFRDDYIRHIPGIYLLAFADPDKQRIAISASIGKDTFKLRYADKFLAAFDAVSVREDDGLNILRQHNYPDGKHILDPVFLADSRIFKDLAEGINVPTDMVVGYVLDENEDIKNLIRKYGNKYVNIAKENLSVEQFMAYFLNAKAIITDSFHGTCFAIIFNKPFRTFGNEMRGNSRFSFLFNTFGLDYDNLGADTDWDSINQIINAEKEKGLEWLKHNLEKTAKNNVRLCKKLHKLAAKSKHHSFWWHLRHLKF